MPLDFAALDEILQSSVARHRASSPFHKSSLTALRASTQGRACVSWLYYGVMPSPHLSFAHEYDRWMSKGGPLAAAMRFAMSVPGQILVNTAAFTLV